MNSSYKNTQFQIKNHLVWSSRSGDIAELKSAIFSEFRWRPRKLQSKNILTECPDFYSDSMSRSRVVVIVLETGYNSDSDQSRSGYAHFKSFRLKTLALITGFGALGGISTTFFWHCDYCISSSSSIGIIYSDQGINPILLTVGST